MPRPPGLVRAVSAAAAVTVGVLAVFGGALPAGAVGATAGDTVAAAVAAAESEPNPVVVIGATGLRWEDVGALTTPALWDLSRTGAVGTIAARSLRPSACPADGWLAVSAGARASDLASDPYGTCRRLREPGTDLLVPGWADYLESAAQGNYGAQPGLLGDTLASAGVTATGVGPGAAVALADSDGRPVGEHVRLPATANGLTKTVETALETSQLVVIDVGTVRDPGQLTVDRPASALDTDGDGQPDPGATALPEPGEILEGDLTAPDAVTEPARSEQVRTIDERIRAVLEAVDESGQDTTVLVASLADSGRQPHLQLAAAAGPSALATGEPYEENLLESRSTRQPGYLMPTDITPTILSALDLRDQVTPGALVGSPATGVPGPPLASQRVAAMVDQDRHAWAVRPLVAPFFMLLIVINLILYGLVTLGLNGVVLARLSSGLSRALPGRIGRAVADGMTSQPGMVLGALRIAGVAVASIPVATFLANLTPWWRVQPASYALTALIIGWVAVITALALLPRWKSWLLGPLGVVAAITAAVIAVDIATGARLQISALMGVQPLVGARFYGFNNQAFALFAASTVLLAVAFANPLVKRGRPGWAAAVVAIVGVVATALDGLPSVGADFGGPPALVPAFAVLALLAGGIRIGWVKALGILGAAAAVVISFAVVDWLRPADSQTHLGRFVQTVLDGGIWPVITRKASQNIEILFGNALTLLAIAGIALVVLVLGRPLRAIASAPDGGPFGWLSAGAPLTQLGTDAPMLRPGLVALAIALGIGFALNDSGVVIPAVGITVVVPLLVAACAGWMLSVRPRQPR
ncbi:hypothetical protein [Pengzhenrongella frigida]|uniref:Alkaline phosphatase family protein n=1 Tax=Pengzhenrongella frigida TaxID=1259133 RepID=A0A4Q5N0M7_9MICO|nr:hypothetical protein [Cellulomonas sp. HLT2-17]RYV51599.1 hypothetical protein EUA98_07670 [Cellulomonas sp. HLT2-17]